MFSRILRSLRESEAPQRPGLVRILKCATKEEAANIGRDWLLHGCTVRLVEARDGTWTVEAWGWYP